MIEVNSVTKLYRKGQKPAVSDVTFSIKSGEIVGFLGPNGAGKTTSMNILTGYISATSGTVKIAGFDMLMEPMRAKSHLGYLPEQPPLYFDMTVLEYLTLVCELKSVSRADSEKHISGIAELVGISDVGGRLIRNLSKGYRQRVGIAQALVGDPDAVILDEPTVGLDPAQIIEIRSLIKNLGKSRTVILSTHILPEVSAICDRVIVISQGKIVADGSTDTLADRFSERHKLVLRLGGPEERALDVLRRVNEIRKIEPSKSQEAETMDYIIETAEGSDIRAQLSNLLASENMPILMLKPLELSLEAVFLRLTEEKNPNSPESSDNIITSADSAQSKNSEDAGLDSPDNADAELPPSGEEDN